MLFPYYYVGQDPTAKRDRAEKIAILGLEVVGEVDLKSVRVARELTIALRSRAASGPYEIAPNSDKELIVLKILHDCEDERKECMVKIGRALDADYLLYGRIQRRSRGATPVDYQVSLRVLNVNSGHLTPLTTIVVPVAEASGARLDERGRGVYDRLIANIRPRDKRRAPVDGVLVRATNQAFWQLTQYKPGQRLDMNDPRDRAMSKTWLDIYDQVRGHRDRATALARRALNETATPYILIVEKGDGSLHPQQFPRRDNLDVQYSWLLDQPERYTYLAMFDFTKKRDAPVYDQFAISIREQSSPTSAVAGAYGPSWRWRRRRW